MKTKSNHQPFRSIYRNQNELLKALFEKAGDPRKVLCVALDYSKTKHLALCCDGHGDILRKPFAVENSVRGVTYLIEQITATAKRRKIPKRHIFLGGEDQPSYVVNFTQALRSRQYLVLRVNAAEAADNRESHHASTDLLDLLGIAKTLLSRRAAATGPAPSRSSKTPPPATDTYFEIREVMRARRALVRQQTAASNRIHALADQLFPGFLDEAKSGLTPFCKASIALMKERFSAPEIARRRHKTLAAFLERNALALRRQAALLLASTPYCLLTSIPGIGFVLAAGLAGELGDPSQLRPLDSLCAFAGIVPRTFQTGGPDRPATQGSTTERFNRILKDWTVQSAQKIHLYGPPELKDRITRWNLNGQHGIFAGARRYLRLVWRATINIPH